jgi:hypothetical protein
MKAAVRLRQCLQALVLFLAIAQAVAPLLHAHFADGSAGPSGVHIHFGLSVPLAAGGHAVPIEVRDFEARIVSTPYAYLRDEALRVLDLPALGAAAVSACSEQTLAAGRFVCVPATVIPFFPKPLPLAPPASA